MKSENKQVSKCAGMVISENASIVKKIKEGKMVWRVTGLGEFFSLNGQVCNTSLRVRRNSEVEATVTNWRSAFAS